MGRGAETATRREVDYDRARAQALTDQLLAERGGLLGAIQPQYQDILKAPGYSEAEKAAITGQGLEALGSTFDALRGRAENRLARTRNTAGYPELLDELAREQGRETSGLARQNQIDFANEAFRRRMASLQGLTGIYGIDTGLLARNLGVVPELLGVRQQASKGGNGFGFSVGPLSFGF